MSIVKSLAYLCSQSTNPECCLKIWLNSNHLKPDATARNNMQQGGQMVATRQHNTTCLTLYCEVLQFAIVHDTSVIKFSSLTSNRGTIHDFVFCDSLAFIVRIRS